MKHTMIKYAAGLLAVSLVAVAARAEVTRDYLMMVGSTTVHPFTSRVAQALVERGNFKRPLMQATGSGGGLMLFCAGEDLLDPDIAYSSRAMKQSEFDICQKNGVKEIVEIKIGYDGIVFVGSSKSAPMNLSLRDIFLALAEQVPDPEGGESFVANPYKTWKDVNAALPDRPIKVYGPARGSGTHYVFRRLGMEGGCRSFDWIKAMKGEDALEYKSVCRTLRDDGAYVAASEDDEAMVEKLESEPDALAIEGFAVFDQHRDSISAVAVAGVKPESATIADDSYPISRPLYLYVKKARVGLYPGIEEFLTEFTSDEAWGEGGYLNEIGLVPMAREMRRRYAADAKNLKPLSM